MSESRSWGWEAIYMPSLCEAPPKSLELEIADCRAMKQGKCCVMHHTVESITYLSGRTDALQRSTQTVRRHHCFGRTPSF